MADVLAEALVELEPDLRDFAKKLKIESRGLTKAIQDSVRGAENEFKAMGDSGASEMRRIADIAEVAQRQTLVGWRETAKGFEKVYQDAATGVERSVSVSFQSIIRQQEQQARSAESELKKLNQMADREARELLRREETQAREISRIVQKFDQDRERESARLAAAQERRAREVAREIQRINDEAERHARRVSEYYEEEGRKSAQALERHIGGALRSLGSSAGRGLLDFSVDTAGLSTAIGQAAKLGGVLSALGIGALAGQAGIGGITAAVAGLSEAVGVIALLPAVGGAAATALGVLALGIQGVGDALSESDPTKFAKALEELAPSAREFARAVRDAQPAAEALQDAVQDALFAGFGREVDRLADVLLPRFQARLVDVASELNDVGFEFTQFLTSTRTIGDVDRLFRLTGKSTDILTAAVQPLLRSLRDVGAVGAEFLPSIAADLASAGIRFGEFIAQARETGALQGFIQRGIDSTKLLISTFGNLGSTIGGVFRASDAAGGGFLEMLDNITERLADVTNSIEGQETLTTFFTSAREIGEDLLPLIGSLARLIGRDIAPLLADVGGNVLPAITRTIDNLGRAIGRAAPGITEFSDGFADFLDSLNAEGVLDTLGQLVDVLGKELAPALRDVGPVLGEVIVGLGSELAEILPKLIPRLADFANSFGELLKPAIDILGVIGDVASQVVLPALTKLADTLTPIIDKIGSKIETVLIPMLPKIESAVSDLIDELGPLVDDIGDGLVEALELIVEIAPDVVGSIGDIAEAMGPLFSVLGPVVGAVSDVNEAFNNLVDSVPGMRRAIGPGGLFGILTSAANPAGPFIGLQRSLTGLMGIMVGQWPDATRTFVDNTRKMGEGATLTLDDIRDNAISFLDIVRAQISEKAPLFTDILLNELGRMEDGSISIFGSIFANLTDLFERTDAKIAEQMFGINDKVDAAWARLNESTSRAFAETEARIAGGIRQASSVVGQFPGLVQSSLGNIGSVLYGSGEALVTGLILGIKAKEYAVRAAAEAVMRAAAGAFPSSPAKYGPFSGQGWTPFRGAALIEGFAEGIAGSIPTLTDATERVMSALEKQMPRPGDFGDAMISELANGGIDVANSLTRRMTGVPASERMLTEMIAAREARTRDVPDAQVPEVRVYIGDRELTPVLTEIIDDKNRKTKRAVTTRARRTL